MVNNLIKFVFLFKVNLKSLNGIKFESPLVSFAFSLSEPIDPINLNTINYSNSIYLINYI